MYLTQALHRSVRQSPERLATICGPRRRTFTEQRNRVSRLAGALRARGVRDDDRIAVLSLNSDRYVELLLAVPWANAVVNPVNIRWNLPEIAYSLTDSGSDVLFVDDQFLPLVPGLRAAHPDLKVVVHMGDGDAPDDLLSFEALIDSGEAIDDAHRSGAALAGIFYTGGTTGHAKGVMLSHANIVASALGSQATCAFVIPEGRLLHAAPMFHIADLAGWAAHSMCAGTHVIVPKFEATACLDAIEEHGVTNVLLVPTMVQSLVDDPTVRQRDLSSVATVLYGASPISEALLERAMEVFPSAGFVQAYGMTEVAPVATLLTPSDHRDGARLRSAGRAAVHSEVRIVDSDGREVPRGEVGEIAVRGAHVMQGYWNKPSETDAVLRDGWMHTGDGAYMDDDGYVYIVDRLKDMIITGGENVYSAEVENAIAQHPAVLECAVIGVPDDRWGERVHAVLVMRAGATITAQELRTHVEQLIASYKAPRTIEVIDALPLSGAGKILKRELRAAHWSGTDRGVG